MRITLLAAAAMLGSVNLANADDTVICAFVLKKTGQQVGYSLAVQPGNSRAVEIGFMKDRNVISHPNGGNPFWYISRSPNGGRNYTYGPDSRYVISVAPGQPELIRLSNGPAKSWNAGLFVRGKRVSRNRGFCMLSVSTVAPSTPPAQRAPTMPEQPSMPQQWPSQPEITPANGGGADLGDAFDANQ